MSPSPDSHWHVLGTGAMGSLFAAALHSAGCAVTLVLREGVGDVEGFENVEGANIDIEREGNITSLDLPCTHPADGGAIDHLLVTTKAYDVRTAVAAIAHRLRADTPVLILVNGMGLREELQQDHPGLAVYCGTTTEGAHRTATRQIRHAGRGHTRLGGMGRDQPAPWFQHWSDALGDCAWDPDIDTALWHKLAINCVINPLTAIHRCANGELARNPTLAQEVTELCGEVCQVSYAAGYTQTAQTLPAAARSVISATAANRSSMLQDIEAHRATEIDYITGYLLKTAQEHGILAPRNAVLYAKVKSIAP